jgi:hypothetical protein
MRRPVFLRAALAQRASLVLCLSAAVWGGCVSAGWYLLESKASIPAEPRHFVDEWPADSKLPRAVDRPTLLVFLHPRCPCSRATLSELARLMVRIADRATVSAVFLAPQELGHEWHQTDLWRSADAIPGVRVIADKEGREARRFRADVSGRTLLYGANGALHFDGGITQARGHAGENSGRSAVESLVLHQKSDHSHGRAFGCPLFAANAVKAAGGQLCVTP